MTCLSLIGLIVVVLVLAPFVFLAGPVAWVGLFLLLVLYLILRDRRTA